MNRKHRQIKDAHGSPVRDLGQMGWKLFRFAMMVAFSFVILYPLIYMVSMAFRPSRDVFDPSVVWIPRTVTVESFGEVVRVSNYLTSLKNTMILSLGSTLLQVFSCSLVGYGFARFKFRGRNLMFFLVIFTIVVPPQTISLPTFILFQDFDPFGIFRAITGKGTGITLLNNPLSFFLMAFMGQGLRSGLFIFFMRQFYRSMPQELEDAAMVDGCGFTRTYFQLMLPNARSVLLVVFILSLVWYWNDYYQSTIYLSSYSTVSTNLANLTAIMESRLGNEVAYDPYQTVTMIQACSLLTLAPLLLIYIIVQRKFVAGVERSGIVG
ncbi:MAG: carbohydrate ABC transporter permease [Clostridiales bacterium]|nr:carbohydrate ABC transporter permease [Clostridiales bacterium]